MATVRAIQDQAVENPDVGGFMQFVKAGTAFDESHSLVKAYPWLFQSDRDADEQTEKRGARR